MKIIKTFREAKGIIERHQQKVLAKDSSLFCEINVLLPQNEVKLLCFKSVDKKIRKRRYEMAVGYEK